MEWAFVKSDTSNEKGLCETCNFYKTCPILNDIVRLVWMFKRLNKDLISLTMAEDLVKVKPLACKKVNT